MPATLGNYATRLPLPTSFYTFLEVLLHTASSNPTNIIIQLWSGNQKVVVLCSFVTCVFSSFTDGCSSSPVLHQNSYLKSKLFASRSSIKTDSNFHISAAVMCLTCLYLAEMDTVCGLVCVCQCHLTLMGPQAALPLSFQAETVKKRKSQGHKDLLSCI